MDQLELTLVTQTFSQLQQDAHRFMTACYANLFAMAPHLRQSFPLDLRTLQQELNRSLKIIIADIEDTPTVKKELSEIARRHSEFGLTAIHVLLAQDAFIRTINQQLPGGGMSWEVREAWANLLSHLTALTCELEVTVHEHPAATEQTSVQASEDDAEADKISQAA